MPQNSCPECPECGKKMIKDKSNCSCKCPNCGAVFIPSWCTGIFIPASFIGIHSTVPKSFIGIHSKNK